VLPRPMTSAMARRKRHSRVKTRRPDRRARHRAMVLGLLGGALVAARGIAWGISRGSLDQPRSDDLMLATREDVRRGVSHGRTWQTVGVNLLSLGAAALAAATGLYVLGALSKPVSLGVSMNGTSAVVHGRWPLGLPSQPGRLAPAWGPLRAGGAEPAVGIVKTPGARLALSRQRAGRACAPRWGCTSSQPTPGTALGPQSRRLLASPQYEGPSGAHL
jgi:hypothetical protein